jgi:hypothetical protein
MQQQQMQQQYMAQQQWHQAHRISTQATPPCNNSQINKNQGQGGPKMTGLSPTTKRSQNREEITEPAPKD